MRGDHGSLPRPPRDPPAGDRASGSRAVPMNDSDLCYCGAVEVAGLLRRREVSPVELTRAVLRRIERIDSQLNSYITVTAESALASAKKAEGELAAGHDRGPLHGVPIA